MTLSSRVFSSSQCWRAGSTVLWGVRCLSPLRWAADLTSLWGTAGSPRRTCVPAVRPPTTPLSRLRAAWRPRAAEAASIWTSTLPSGVHSMMREAEWEVSRWFLCILKLCKAENCFGGSNMFHLWFCLQMCRGGWKVYVSTSTQHCFPPWPMMRWCPSPSSSWKLRFVFSSVLWMISAIIFNTVTVWSLQKYCVAYQCSEWCFDWV